MVDDSLIFSLHRQVVVHVLPRIGHLNLGIRIWKVTHYIVLSRAKLQIFVPCHFSRAVFD